MCWTPGPDGRVREHCLLHDGIYLQHEGTRHLVDFSELICRTVTFYGQQQVANDPMLAHDALGSGRVFRVE